MATEGTENLDQGGVALDWDSYDPEDVPAGAGDDLDLGTPFDLESENAFPPEEPEEVAPEQQPGTEPPTPEPGDQDAAGNGSELDRLAEMTPEERRKVIRRLSYDDAAADGIAERLLRPQEKTGTTPTVVPQPYVPPLAAPVVPPAPAPEVPAAPAMTAEQHFEMKMDAFRQAHGRDPVSLVELTDWSAEAAVQEVMARNETLAEAGRQVQDLRSKYPDVTEEQITAAVRAGWGMAQAEKRGLQPGDIEAGYRAKFGTALEQRAVERDRAARQQQAQRAAATPAVAPASPKGEPKQPYTADFEEAAARAKRDPRFGGRRR